MLINITIKTEIKVILAILVRLNWSNGGQDMNGVWCLTIGQRPTHDTVH